MSDSKRLVFLTGTRADFGKLRSLIDISIAEGHQVHLFVTGMHLQKKFGHTVEEIEKRGYKNIYKYINHTSHATMDHVLAKTVEGFSAFVQEIEPDLIIVHGDRVEALAGAIVGSLNNILVGHVEGGEVSGTIDELIRHAVSKMSHSHFVANLQAKKRLLQMGELEESIFVIGSPDIDIMVSEALPSLEESKERYEISFDNYGMVLFHPVTTDFHNFTKYANNLVDALLESGKEYVIIFPNNDLGYEQIIEAYQRLKDNPKFKIFPSLRFEHFLTLLKNSELIIGNSSAGIREAPYYGLPTINIGSRQENRALTDNIYNCDYSKTDILNALSSLKPNRSSLEAPFGDGRSDSKFLDCLNSDTFWKINKQKQFKDLSADRLA